MWIVGLTSMLYADTQDFFKNQLIFNSVCPEYSLKMSGLEWPRLENFIPQDLLELIRLLRCNFTKINRHVKDSPAGAVPNYYYNVLSQQYMNLSERLLAALTEAELKGLDIRARVHLSARFALLEEFESSQEMAQDKEISAVVKKPFLDEEALVDRSSSEPVAFQQQELEVSTMPQDIDLDTDLDELNDTINLPTALCKSLALQPGVTQGAVTAPVVTSSSSPSHESQESNLPKANDPDMEQGRDNSAATQATTRCGSERADNGSPTVDAVYSIPVFGEPTTLVDKLMRKTRIDGYAVEMQNVRPATMSIENKVDELKTLQEIVVENKPRMSILRSPKDIRHVRWISKDAYSKQTAALMVKFRTVEQANAAISQGLLWEGRVFNCRRYAGGCSPVQCDNCQSYGHRGTQCTLPTRCGLCAGPHPTPGCSSLVTKCALCGAGHRASSAICQKLTVEINRVSEALGNTTKFWPAETDSRKGSRKYPEHKEPTSVATALSTSKKAQDAELSNFRQKQVLPKSNVIQRLPRRSTFQEQVKLANPQTRQFSTRNMNAPSRPAHREGIVKELLKPISANPPWQRQEIQSLRWPFIIPAPSTLMPAPENESWDASAAVLEGGDW